MHSQTWFTCLLQVVCLYSVRMYILYLAWMLSSSCGQLIKHYIIYVHLCTVLCAFIVHSISLSFGLSALMSYTSQPKRAPWLPLAWILAAMLFTWFEAAWCGWMGNQGSRKPWLVAWLMPMGLLERPVFDGSQSNTTQTCRSWASLGSGHQLHLEPRKTPSPFGSFTEACHFY